MPMRRSSGRPPVRATPRGGRARPTPTASRDGRGARSANKHGLSRLRSVLLCSSWDHCQDLLTPPNITRHQHVETRGTASSRSQDGLSSTVLRRPIVKKSAPPDRPRGLAQVGETRLPGVAIGQLQQPLPGSEGRRRGSGDESAKEKSPRVGKRAVTHVMPSGARVREDIEKTCAKPPMQHHAVPHRRGDRRLRRFPRSRFCVARR